MTRKVCPQCKRVFRKKWNFEYHIQHDVCKNMLMLVGTQDELVCRTGMKPAKVQCTFCQRKFVSVSGFSLHVCVDMTHVSVKRRHEERVIGDKGYVSISVPYDHITDMRGVVREHSYVMAKHLGRPLLDTETVHHKNGIRDDNDIDNLELWASPHPYGQRVTDLVAFAKSVLAQYEDEVTRGVVS